MKSFHELAALDGRVALVTGGAGHLGSTICRALAGQGAQVVAADLQTALERRPPAPDAVGVAVDLRDPELTRALVRDVTGRFGRLDVVVHSAAYVGDSRLPGWNVPLPEQTIEAWDLAVRLNLTAGFVLAQAAREPLAQSGHGSLIFISSIYGLVAPDPAMYLGTEMQNPAAYGASKAGLIQLARHLAAHFAPDVRVNVLSPGGIERGQPAVFVDRYVSRTPLARMGREEDVVGAIGFLASDLSAYVTGHNLVVDGGWTTW